MIAKKSLWVIAALALISIAPDVAAQLSSGTAFSVASEFLITTRHVVAGCSSVGVFAGNVRRTGSVVDADIDTDLALLHVKGIKGSTAQLRNPRTVRLGEAVM